MITSIWTAPGGDASVARHLREQVFCEELGLPPELSWDESDRYAFHLVLMMGDVPVAAGRLTYGGIDTAALGRICVAKRYRRQGIGDGLVKIMDFKAAAMGMKQSAVNVPQELEHFYHRLGYVQAREPFQQWDRTLTPMKKETNDGTRENCSHKCTCP